MRQTIDTDNGQKHSSKIFLNNVGYPHSSKGTNPTRERNTKKLSVKKRFLTESILCVSAALSPAASNFKVKLDESQEEQLSVELLTNKIISVLSSP